MRRATFRHLPVVNVLGPALAAIAAVAAISQETDPEPVEVRS